MGHVMGGYRTALAAVLLVAACGGNPFIVEDDDGTPLDPEDPNTSVNSKFAWDPKNDLTMNAVTYDRANNQLVINNLPFDGPDGRYDNVFTLANGVGAYGSRQTDTTGKIKHYAVFIESDYMQATAAAGVNWVQYGNAGANINRSAFRLPASGEYEYAGTYAANRTFDSRSGIELVTGDVELLVDVSDFDPAGGIQGDIIGQIYNRTRVDLNTGAAYGEELPRISLVEVSFNTQFGTFGDADEGTLGEVVTALPSGGVWSEGTYGGLFGGPNGEELGGFLVMEGTANIKVVQYEVVNYRTAGGELVIATGLQVISSQQLEAMINSRDPAVVAGIPNFIAAPALPPGATLVSTATQNITISTDYNAREIGVFIGDQVATP